ncbi:MAG TPA: hypothetical protein VHO46_06170 [Bacteroidales bacterium]|nr:hypothetical protein [Bacteroidales bacterium]
MTTGAEKLSHQACHLRELVSFFKTGSGELDYTEPVMKVNNRKQGSENVEEAEF